MTILPGTPKKGASGSIGGVSETSISLDNCDPIELIEDGTVIRRSVVGGVRFITQSVPTTRSVAIGFWVPAGSRDEEYGGATHYLEHLLFKGTKSGRSATDIANSFDAVGGESNAVTAKESTHYYANVLATDLPMAVEVLMDMVTAPALQEADFQMERSVIVEELTMALDDPQDVLHQAFAAEVFPNHPLGLPVGGTIESVQATPLHQVRAHHERWYGPDTLVVAAAGKVDHEQLIDMVLKALDPWRLDDSTTPRFPERQAPVLPESAAEPLTLYRPFEQAHVLLGCDSIPAGAPNRHVLSLLSVLLGGGMSSRLFQEIREKRGLAYSTYAFQSAYSDSGTFALYAGCAPDNVTECAHLMEQQWSELAAGNFSEHELQRVKGQLTGGLLLGLEDNVSRMSRLGTAEIVSRQLLPINVLSEKISGTEAAEIAQLAADLYQRRRVQVELLPQRN